MIRAVVFDFNGVLVDDEPLHFELFREVLAHEGIELSAQRYHDAYLGYDDRGCFDAALRDAGRAAETRHVDRLIARKAARYVERAAEGLRYFPGAARCVATLADRWPVAVCSGALRSEIELALAQLGVRDRVDAIVAAEDVDRCKPDPEAYFLALDALRSTSGFGLEAGQCLVVEDSLAGIQSAKAAGMWAFGVPHTYREDQLRAAGADAVLPSLETLTAQCVERFFAPEGSP
jgi:HAD superfamily hydrolase (TIGR01509 family)